MSQTSPRFLSINEHGEIFIGSSDKPIKDPEQKNLVLNNLELDSSYHLRAKIEDQTFHVEAFDFPLIAQDLSFKDGKLIGQTAENIFFEVPKNKLFVDFIDRFCGFTTNKIPFVLSKGAQEKLFEAVDDYDDDSITFGDTTIQTPNFFLTESTIEKMKEWNEIYTQESTPPWSLQQPSLIILDMIPRLKLPKSRILILGCGEGFDAIPFAEAGHVVTLVDFSPEAIAKAKQNLAQYPNVSFEVMDVFDVPHSWNHSFDLIVEHTLFCAINPDLRNKLITVWKRLLHEEGQILSIFYVMYKQFGPPYGATEFEIRHRLNPHFQFLFWTRAKNSVPRRLGQELFVLAKKR